MSLRTSFVSRLVLPRLTPTTALSARAHLRTLTSGRPIFASPSHRTTLPPSQTYRNTKLLHSTTLTMSDQYNAKSQQNDLSLSEKLTELEGIIKPIRTSMLTTIGTNDGLLHSRAMRDASHENLLFTYIYDNTSHKDDEIKQHQEVNISFLEPTGGDWVSMAGKVVNQSNDTNEVAKYYNPSIKAWFGDLGDGIHDGSEKDPRVSIMQIKPSEIRYFARKKTMVGQAIDVVTSAVSGSVAKPGSIRTITAAEIQSIQK